MAKAGDMVVNVKVEGIVPGADPVVLHTMDLYPSGRRAVSDALGNVPYVGAIKVVIVDYATYDTDDGKIRIDTDGSLSETWESQR